jgi:hypothetical protein
MARWTLIAVLLTSGCVHVDSSLLNSSYTSDPVPGGEVAVFLGDDVVPGDCERVAIVHASGGVRVMDALREEAGRLGANAVDIRVLNTRTEIRDGPGESWDALALRCSG